MRNVHRFYAKITPLQTRDLSANFGIQKGSWIHPSRCWGMVIFTFSPSLLLSLFFLLDFHLHSSCWSLDPRQWHNGAGCSQCQQQLPRMQLHFVVTGSQPILSSGPCYRCNHPQVYLPEMRSCYFVNYKENIQGSDCHAAGAPEAWFSDCKLRNYRFPVDPPFMFPC